MKTSFEYARQFTTNHGMNEGGQVFTLEELFRQAQLEAIRAGLEAAHKKIGPMSCACGHYIRAIDPLTVLNSNVGEAKE